MEEQPVIRVRERGEPLYELSLGGDEEHCKLIATVYRSHSSEGSQVGRFPVIDYTMLGPLKILPRDERGYFIGESLDRLIQEVEEGCSDFDIHGKPFFVNAFLFARKPEVGKWNGNEVLYDCQIEFYQIEVDKKSRIQEKHK